MFRIDRNLVNLASARSVYVDGDDAATDAEGAAAPDAAAAAASAAHIVQELIRNAEVKAEGILENARKEVAALMLSSREQADEERRQALQEGYIEGSKEGRRAYEEKYAKKSREDDESLKRVIAELYEERKRTYDGIEDEVVGLAFEIVKKVIGQAEDEVGGVFESLIRNALKQIAPEGKIIIRVSPAEYERFFSSGSAVFELDKNVTVAAAVLRDASLEQGDCLIDAEDETINAGLNTQLDYIKIAFTEVKGQELSAQV